jgi:hypothetical protein
MTVDQPLPTEQLINRQSIAKACFIDTKQATTHSGNDFSFPTHNPSFCGCWRKISDGQWTPVRPNNMSHTRFVLINFVTHYTAPLYSFDTMMPTMPSFKQSRTHLEGFLGCQWQN